LLQEVLAEIQRLKEEASRFIAILSQEEEYEKSDAQLSPTKRQALTKEVESLQVFGIVHKWRHAIFVALYL
jgi:hypothetical protein